MTASDGWYRPGGASLGAVLATDSCPFQESELRAVGAELGEYVAHSCAQGRLAAREEGLTWPAHSLPVVHGRQRSFCRGPADRFRRALRHGSGTPEKWTGWAARRGSGFTVGELRPFPRSLPPNPPGGFHRNGLSSNYAACVTGVAWMTS